MKLSRLRVLSAIAAVGLLFSAAPAHATDAKPDPSAPLIVKPDPSDRIPHPRPPRIPPCPSKPAPPGWAVPLYCEIGPIIPIPGPPREIIPGPVVPGPIVPADM